MNRATSRQDDSTINSDVKILLKSQLNSSDSVSRLDMCILVQVNGSIWRLGDALCDTWVAFDVMCCTSSILNLTAISVDRYSHSFYSPHLP